jgi:RHS repeat-associated protein
MADENEAPQPSESLEQASNGALVVREYDSAGAVVDEREVSSEEALRFLNQLVALYGPDNVPVGDGGTGAFTRPTLQDNFLQVIDRIWRSLPGDDEAKERALATILGAVVTAPEAMSMLESPALPRAFLVRVWSDFEARTGSIGGGAELGDRLPLGLGSDEFASERAIAGSERVGRGGVPVTASPPGVADIAGSGAGPGSASGGTVPDAARASDPVLPFTGELLMEVTDLEIAGIGIDLELRRTYLHNVHFSGPLGPRWDHSYNLWLREAVEPVDGGGSVYAVYQSSGGLREVRFTASVDADVDPGALTDVAFMPPAGTGGRLEKRDGRFVWAAEGRELWYDDNLLAERIRDRNGNEIHLVYDSEPPGRLVELVDTCQRRILLEYNVEGLLSHVVDTSLGRHVWYGYDGGGRLQTVRKSVDDTGCVILVAGYRYWGDEAPPGLEHNVVGLIDGRGTEVLQVRYGDEPGDISFNRVIEQRDGGITSFEYEYVVDVNLDDRLNAPAVRVRMTLPAGDTQVCEYSVLGRIVRLDVEDHNPLTPRSLVTRWRYNADGAVVSEERADGSETRYFYGRELFELTAGVGDEPTTEQRARFGQLRRIVESRRPGTDTPPTRITEYEYHPEFALLTERRGPAYGDALGNAVADALTWTRRYDYDAVGNLVGIRSPDCRLPDGAMQAGATISLILDDRGRTIRRDQLLDDDQTLATEFDYPDANSPHPHIEYQDADGLRLELRYEHDAAGRAYEARDPAGLRVVVELDHLGRTRREEAWLPGHAVPISTIYEWGPLALPCRIRRNRTDAQGVEEPSAELVEEFTFDPDGDVESSRLRSADGVVDQLLTVERTADRLLSTVTIDGISRHSSYDSRGRPVEMWVSAGDRTTRHRQFAYDRSGRLSRVIGAAGDDTELDYDGFGRLETVQRGGTTERLEWDAADRVVRSQVFGNYPGVGSDAELSDETRGYDEAGRLVRRSEAVFDPRNPVSRTAATLEITYDRADRPHLFTCPGVSRRLRYDALSRVIGAGDGVGTETTYTYDDVSGEETEDITLSGAGADGHPMDLRLVYRRRFDPEGRLVREVDGLGNTTTAEYDSRGSLTATVDANGVRTERTYWPDDTVRGVTAAVGTTAASSLSYGRAPGGRLSHVDGDRGRLLTVGWDAFARVESFTMGDDPSRETVRIARDEDGRVSTMTDASGAVTTLSYDGRGVVSRVTISAPDPSVPSTRHGAVADTRYELDGAGRLVKADDGVRPVTRRYDSRGLLLEEELAGATCRWTYDAMGRQSSFEYPDGRRVECERHSDGRLLRLVDRVAGGATSELLRVWPVASGTFVQQEWRGLLTRTDTVDAAGRLASIAEQRVSDGVELFSVAQLADARGATRVRRTMIDATGETVVADTDPHNRLVSVLFDVAAGVPTGAVAVQDELDLRLTAIRDALPVGAETIVLTLDADGARRSYERRAGGAVVEQRDYTVDAAGRSVEIGRYRIDDVDGLPRIIDGDTFRYDAWRRLVRVERGGSELAGLAYDALGRIAQVRNAAGTTDLRYAGNDLVERRSGALSPTQLVWLPSGPLVEVGSPTAPRRALVDGQGSVVGLSDGTDVVAGRSWDPFGELRTVTGPWAAGPDFHGLVDVPDTEMLMTPTRTYDPRSGAFYEGDPMGFVDGSNRWIYAAGNPLAFSDPNGLMAQPTKLTGAPRPEGLGLAFGHGSYSPEDNFFWRAAMTMSGALKSLAGGVAETGLSVVDVVGLTADIVASGKLDYRLKSGIGQAAAEGRIKGGLDVLRYMATSIAQTPARALAAAERGDYGTFGEEAMNIVMLARAGAAAPRAVLGVAEIAGNPMIRGLGALGPTGRALRAWIRTRQLRWMQRKAAPLAGVDERVWGPPKRLRYVESFPGEPGVVAMYNAGADLMDVSEAAFRPFGRIGLYQGAFRMAKARWEIGNILRGNYTLRTLVHENFHRFQAKLFRPEYMQWRGTPYPVDPREFLSPRGTPGWGVGAWDFEMTVPAGPVATFVGLLAALEDPATR